MIISALQRVLADQDKSQKLNRRKILLHRMEYYKKLAGSQHSSPQDDKSRIKLMHEFHIS